MSEQNNSNSKWIVGFILSVLLGAAGLVFGFSRPPASEVKEVEKRVQVLERKSDVRDANYDHILERLTRIEGKIDELKK